MSYRREDHYSSNESYFIQLENNIRQQYGVDFSTLSTEKLEQLWLKTVKKGMHGICFSLYEDGQKPGDIITEEQVDRRIQIIKPYTKWIY